MVQHQRKRLLWRKRLSPSFTKVVDENRLEKVEFDQVQSRFIYNEEKEFSRCEAVSVIAGKVGTYSTLARNPSTRLDESCQHLISAVVRSKRHTWQKVLMFLFWQYSKSVAFAACFLTSGFPGVVPVPGTCFLDTGSTKAV
jgi:hypothetical protein